MRRILTTDRME
jgi:ubiquinone biosynthesis protein COQ9